MEERDLGGDGALRVKRRRLLRAHGQVADQDVDLGVITGRYDGELNEEAKELLAEIQQAEAEDIAQAEEENK